MLRSYIMHTRVYIHGVTRDVLKPLYTSVTDKLQRIYMPQAPGLAAATMGKGGGQGKTIFHVLKRRELRQTWWIKTAARREFRYEKLWREARKKYRVNLFEKVFETFLGGLQWISKLDFRHTELLYSTRRQAVFR